MNTLQIAGGIVSIWSDKSTLGKDQALHCYGHVTRIRGTSFILHGLKLMVYERFPRLINCPTLMSEE